MDLQKILTEGVVLCTSGTTGTPKEIFQSPAKLIAANKSAIESQHLTKNSRVYTVCKTKHAGGLLAQTLPAYSIGAEVVIDDFNAYTWTRNIRHFTHSHLTPDHCRAIMGTKAFRTLNLSGIWITCGSDYVTWDIIESFVRKGCIFVANWGMTEVGPCAINVTFKTFDDVKKYKLNATNNSTILGDTFYCDYKIINNELYVSGDICVHKGWFATGDKVELNNGVLYYYGRI